ncbi:DNA polymerase III subunit gamma/tau [Tahibacter harae]|uniref:DNA polymerase III subunit gamma/tau n=1 Tax=Tahibacter harae TaxID=2963937 RepID=A0ABT1QLC8_9GAMM|nr:DNA polymerase III subunit gamma/tau [Tahibacter harae]MCQ4163222.1 DNA polymerase III subunit gamma/tau [Tahibacter harae]
MSYQVLARKWRPRRFSELVGQEHVVRALSNALDGGRLHHAFLFTGTRGVGKTTIARIFAKSLNCERGQSSQPCGECRACLDIDAGRFVDLLEIDAASHTGVDDVREMIESAQYTPARGRQKVFLIDEVHMLSKNAFNALLKTLEEPPAHVKFLLATTDPQKLPVTVLSRCLKFNLKRLLPEQIGAQMRHILDAEQVGFDAEAIQALAKGADGSLRDGLSLLDQAIAYGGGSVRTDDVRAMLGTIERAQVGRLLTAVCANDGNALFAEVAKLAEFAPDFGLVLDDLAGLLHRIQLRQLVPDYLPADSADAQDVAQFAQSLAPDEVQLYYQLCISGRRDLALAPTPRAGFEMALLRLLAFGPAGEGGGNTGGSGGGSSGGGANPGPRSGAAAAAAAIAAIPAARAQEPAGSYAVTATVPSQPVAQAGTAMPASPPTAAPAAPVSDLPPLRQAQVAAALPDTVAAMQTTPPPPLPREPVAPFTPPVIDVLSQAVSPPRAEAQLQRSDAAELAGEIHVPRAAGIGSSGQTSAAPGESIAPRSAAVASGVSRNEFAAYDEAATWRSDVAARGESMASRGEAAASGVPAASGLVEIEPRDWPLLIERAGLRGPVGQLAQHAVLVAVEGNTLRLALKAEHDHLNSAPMVAMLQEKLAAATGRPLRCVFELARGGMETPAEQNARQRNARQLQAEQDMEQDPFVQAAMRELGARLVPNSVRLPESAPPV